MKEISEGVTKKLKIPRFVQCQHCAGTGAKNGTAFHTCNRCHGSGVVEHVQQTFLGAMSSTATCPECNGEGKTITEKCTYCNGEGIVRQEEVVEFTIPAGVSDGMVLTLKGKGQRRPVTAGVTGQTFLSWRKNCPTRNLSVTETT